MKEGIERPCSRARHDVLRECGKDGFRPFRSLPCSTTGRTKVAVKWQASSRDRSHMDSGARKNAGHSKRSQVTVAGFMSNLPGSRTLVRFAASSEGDEDSEILVNDSRSG